MITARRKAVPASEAIEKPVSKLTGRQAQVLYLRSRGWEREDIASQLGITIDTVKKHCKLAIRKLAAKNIVHAVSISIRCGWI